jgi:very-short-patch-repair endonuclease
VQHGEEGLVWALHSRYGPRVRLEVACCRHIVDFACRQAKLVVEIEGGQHAESERDIIRDQWLAGQGWSVFRVWNGDVRENPTGTAEAIVARAAECLGGTHPEPLPFREGRKRRPLFSGQRQQWVESRS